MKKRITFPVVGLVLALAAGGVGASILAATSKEPTVVWGAAIFSPNYDLGSTIFVPEIDVTVDGSKQTVSPAILYPSKKLIQKASATLDEVGKYTIIYQTVVNGKAYSNTHDFIVNTNLFDLSPASSAYYGKPENAATHEGLVIDLAQGDEMMFNQPIDVANFTADDIIISGYIAPREIGSFDFEKLLITFYDAENPEIWYRQHIRRRDMTSTGVNAVGVSYYYGGGNGQGTAGANVKEADPQSVNKNNEWGPYSPLPFDGVYNVIYSDGGELKESVFDKTFFHVDDYQFRLSIDMAGLEVYTTEHQRDRTGALIPGGLAKHFITDLNNPNFYSTLFSGFPSGKIKVGISADRYVKETARFVVTGINGMDLQETLFVDNEGPKITVDNPFGDQMPLGQVHFSYPIPDATAVDTITGECEVTKKVWFNYSTPRQTQISIIDNKFQTEKVGWYTIEYLAHDAFGNESQELLSVFSGSSIPELKVNIGEHPTSMYMGQKLVPASFSVENSSGDYEVEIAYIDPNSDRHEYEEGFIPEVQGDWQVEFTATDMIGRTTTSTYELGVSISELPILVDSQVLPKAIIGGGLYELPEKTGRLYTDDYEYEIVTCDLVVSCCGIEEDVYGEYIAPSYLENGAEVNCSYYFDGNLIEESNIPYVRSLDLDATEEYPIIVNYANYFIGDDFDIVRSPAGINKGIEATLTDASERSSILFANPVLADKVNFEFTSESKNLFSGFELKLTDSLNPKQTVTTRVDMSLYDSLATVDGVTQKLAYSKTSEGAFSLSYEKGTLTIMDEVKAPFTVNHYDSGLPFLGFDSAKVYIELCLLDANANASINIRKINNHSFINIGEPIDRTIPEVVESGAFGGSYASGSVYATGTLIASDVIAPNVDCYLTIKDSDHTIGRDLDPSESYNIPLDIIGTYTFKYTVDELFYCDDYSGENTYERIARVYSVDAEAPVITLLSNMPGEAHINDIIDIADYAVSDNYTATENIIVSRMIAGPHGLIYTISDDVTRLKVTMAGIYEIRYLAMDEQGNTSLLTHQILVS